MWASIRDHCTKYMAWLLDECETWTSTRQLTYDALDYAWQLNLCMARDKTWTRRYSEWRRTPIWHMTHATRLVTWLTCTWCTKIWIHTLDNQMHDCVYMDYLSTWYVVDMIILKHNSMEIFRYMIRNILGICMHMTVTWLILYSCFLERTFTLDWLGHDMLFLICLCVLCISTWDLIESMWWIRAISYKVAVSHLGVRNLYCSGTCIVQPWIVF